MQQISKEHINRLVTGHEPTFKELFEVFYPRLVGLAMKYISDIMAAEDVVSDVFQKIWEKRTSLSEIGSFEAFLYTSVRNALLNHIRNQDRKNGHHQHIFHEQRLDGFEETIIEENVHHRLYQAIDKLPKKGKKIFELSVINGWKDKEIAEELNISINTVKTHKKRALKDLRKGLGNYYNSLFVFL